MCGEHLFGVLAFLFQQGSSPRVRGTPSIPRLSPSCMRDHPRVCGEHQPVRFTSAVVRGSSPRVRGTHQGESADGATLGIIPACAGNTRSVLNMPASYEDHPRVCGEHYKTEDRGESYWGSSPRVRGTPALPGRDSTRSGIIPACAGNTFMQLLMTMTKNGSSPRVRGTR